MPLYTDADVAWIVNCRIFRASGMPLATIAKLARLIRKGEGTERERLVVLREHQERIAAQLADLRRARELIDAKVASYEKHLAAGTAAGLWVGPRG
ncbi:MerR family DNA-binding protein [Archangium violaceum]|uniref:MerR family DNA-binding protein n=1 Tax=Archangium violaceum TaxID=83451 RepID=UPI00193B4B39|nr:MerR family DNA-binding protein [Archangium violaceum]QRK07608.1 MerR family DNA-binding protein [Archangium violaceum]